MTQGQLKLSKNGQLGLKHPRRKCGYCGFTVTINADRTMRVHGPMKNRCIGSGVRWLPMFHTSRRFGGITKRWGTCGICGAFAEYPDLHGEAFSPASPDVEKWMRTHNHERPTVRKDRETGQWTMLVVNHRTGNEFTVSCDTHEDAQNKAMEYIKMQDGR